MARTLRKQILSMRGEPVDFGALAAQNEQQPTLGNTRTNVRGDLLGDNGTVLKTQEQIEAEWARKRALQASVNRASSIKADTMRPKTVPAPQPTPRATTIPEDVEFPTIGDLVKDGTISTPSKRKMSDRD